MLNSFINCCFTHLQKKKIKKIFCSVRKCFALCLPKRILNRYVGNETCIFPTESTEKTYQKKRETVYKISR